MFAETLRVKGASSIGRLLMKKSFPKMKSFIRVSNPKGGERTGVLEVRWYDGPAEESVRSVMEAIMSDEYCWITPKGDIVPTGIKAGEVHDISQDDEPMVGSKLVVFPYGELKLIRMATLRRVTAIINELKKKYKMPEKKLSVVNKGKSNWVHDDYVFVERGLFSDESSMKVNWMQRANILLKREDTSMVY